MQEYTLHTTGICFFPQNFHTFFRRKILHIHLKFMYVPTSSNIGHTQILKWDYYMCVLNDSSFCTSLYAYGLQFYTICSGTNYVVSTR